MLFMGEEYADESPFYYFVSHSDPQLVEAVRKGRKEEFKDYPAEAQPPDAQDENTFLASALRWHKRTERKHQLILNWHRTIIRLRKETPALQNFSKNDIRTYIIDPLALVVHRQLPGGKKHVLCLFNFSETEVAFTFPSVAWKWMKRLDSKEKEWMLDAKDHSRLPQQVAAGEKVQLPPLSAILYTDTAQ
jgi:maltooligosyltrehalose trehalohydrolase